MRIYNNFELDKGVLKPKGYNQNHVPFQYVRGFDFLKAISEQLIKKGELNPVMHQNLEKIMNYTLK